LRILIDTNIFIYRESDKVVSDSLQKLVSIIVKYGIKLLIHPSSKKDLQNDKNCNRREILLSKIGTYPLLENPPNYINDVSFNNTIGTTKNKNSQIDNEILYAIYKDAADFLVTEDLEIHKKAIKLQIDNRVFLIYEALQFLVSYFTKEQIIAPPALVQLPVYSLNVSDHIFDSLKASYPEFEDWFQKISREGRKAWVHFREDGSIGALLIYKEEEEAIIGTPLLFKKKRIKISSFKVSHVGFKLGELFIRIACDIATQNNIDEIYFTYFPNTDNRLIDLVSEFGFFKVSTNHRGEEVYLKRTVVQSNRYKMNPEEIASQFYPSFYDGPIVRKFIVPIRPKYHDRLFTSFSERQLHEIESYNFLPEGNTILKAYICHAKIRKMRQGDVLLFYLSEKKKITTLGTVKSVDYDITDSSEIIRRVGKRTVYSAIDIEEKAKKQTMVIMFRFHFHFSSHISYKSLESGKILKGPPQSIIQLNDDKYQCILNMDGIDGRYIIR
jgi:hypothetical protein